MIECGTDRTALVRQIQELLGAVGTPETSDDPAMISLANDFLAMGSSWWMLRDLAIAMGHPDAINHQALTREILAGADAWQSCDRSTASNRLRAGFEVLTQARERFYPVDAYLVDLCLLDPAMPAGVLGSPLESHVALTLLAPAAGDREPGRPRPCRRWNGVRQAITEGWIDIVGGPYMEAEDLVLPLESILWQFRRGARGLSAASRRAECRDLRPPAVRTVHPASSDRQAVRLSVRAPPRFRRRSVPDPAGDQAALGKPRRHQPGDLASPSPGRRSTSARADAPLASGRDHEERPRGDPAAGSLARAGRVVVRRPSPRCDLLSGAGSLGHAQRLLSPDGPALRDVPSRSRLVRLSLPRTGRFKR